MYTSIDLSNIMTGKEIPLNRYRERSEKGENHLFRLRGLRR